MELNEEALRVALERRGDPATLNVPEDSAVSVPMPDGSMARFNFLESEVMAPELAARFPEIRTYSGRGIDDPGAAIYFDISPAGFHAQVLSARGAVYIDPVSRGDAVRHVSYYKRDYLREAGEFRCETLPVPSGARATVPAMSAPLSGGQLRIFRLACAATGEYVQLHGGTVSAGLAAIVTAINRVNGVYEADLAVRLVLVANNDLLVYTNAATDPYSNSDTATMLTQNQANIDAVIGSANYDVGHVFSTGNGGRAYVGSVCVDLFKAGGATGRYPPNGDAFWIDYVAHEMGHQFGASHTFNSTSGACNGGNRNAVTAYEPGSGSTIMGYAGICDPNNLQLNSDPYFHFASLGEIFANLAGQATCATIHSNSNSPPVVDAGPDFVIPGGTPFVLTATATDPDGDVVTYCWEERDLGPTTALGDPDNGLSPLFRSFSPGTNGSRVFPRLSDLLANRSAAGEKLPTTARTMNFRVTARDNRAGGGAVSIDDLSVTVVTNGGPFALTTPNTAVVWSNVQTITWNVAGTTNAPINAAAVDLLLSTNGGQAFPFVLAANTPNDGSQPVVLPPVATTNARVKVQAVANVFFDVSNTNFTLEPYTPQPQIMLGGVALVGENCMPTNGAVDAGESVLVRFDLRNSGSADTTNLMATLLSANGVSLPGPPQSYGVVQALGESVSRVFAFAANAGCGAEVAAVLSLSDGGVSLGTVTQVFRLGRIGAVARSFTNAAGITIADNQAAAPYPSSIGVSGVTGAVEKVSVSIRGFTHSFPGDVDMILVGPGGRNLLLMSDAGGETNVNGLNVTFDDAATLSLPQLAQITNGVYRPTNYDTNSDLFPAPAPAGPYASALAVFQGAAANGTWSLFVRDDGPQDSGEITNGWVLTLTTSNALCCTGPVNGDAGLAATLLPPVVNEGASVVYTVMVSNAGPATAFGVIVTNRLDEAFSFLEADISAGEWVEEHGTVRFTVGTLPAGGVALLSLTAMTTVAGVFTNLFVLSSSTADPVGSNNLVAVTTTVNALPRISGFAERIVPEDGPPITLDFVVSDAESAPEELELLAVSGDTNLFPETGFVFGGSGSNRTVTFSSSPDRHGTAVVTVVVSDGVGSAALPLLVTVYPVNDAPVLQPIGSVAVFEETTLMLTNSASDVDTAPDRLIFSTDAPTGLEINPTNGVLHWTPPEADGPSINLVTVVVSDDGEPPLSASQSFLVIVLESNRPPVLEAIADVSVVEGETLFVTNLVTDPDIPTNSLVYALGAGAPAGMDIDEISGLISWSPGEQYGGSTNMVTVVVTDDGFPEMMATQSFAVVVLETNSAPVLAELPDVLVVEGQTLLVTNLVTDPDIPTNSFVFALGTNAPPALQINTTNGLITWTPGEVDGPSSNLVSVVVTDDGVPPLATSRNFAVLVLETNSAPVLAELPDVLVVEGQTLVVTNLVTDPDIPTNSFVFALGTNAPAAMQINPTNGLITWIPGEADGPSSNMVTVAVTDDGEPPLSASRSFLVLVLETNQPPVLQDIVDYFVHAGSVIQFQASALDPDLPADDLVFSFVDTVPAGATLDTNGSFLWVTTDADAFTTNELAIVVADNGLPSLSDTNRFKVTVVPRPAFTYVAVSNQVVTLRWGAIAGQRYGVQYQENPAGTNWAAFAAEFVPEGTVGEAMDETAAGSQRVYRLFVP